MAIVQCAICGKETYKRPSQLKKYVHVFCSTKCMGESNRGTGNARYVESIKTQCATCGDEIIRTPSQFSRSEHHFCDVKCKGDWMSKHQVGENHPLWEGKTLELECDYCGALFKRTASHLGKSNHCSKQCYDDSRRTATYCAFCCNAITVATYKVDKSEKVFCNRKCYAQWQSANERGEVHRNWTERHQKVCVGCGANFEIVQGKQWRRYCSRACGLKNRPKKFGAEHHRWTGGGRYYYGDNWLVQKIRTLRRDRYQCQHCKRYKGQEGVRLHIHHIRPFRLFGYVPGENRNFIAANDLSNLITLCSSCHGKAEPREASTA